MNFFCVEEGHLRAQVSMDHRDFLEVAMGGLPRSSKRNEGTLKHLSFGFYEYAYIIKIIISRI